MAVSEFCRGCDLVNADSTCRTISPDGQKYNAQRKLCEVAKVGGVPALRTGDGFILQANAIQAGATVYTAPGQEFGQFRSDDDHLL